jgi:hypothetical protein
VGESSDRVHKCGCGRRPECLVHDAVAWGGGEPDLCQPHGHLRTSFGDLAAKVRALHDYAHDQWDVAFNAGIAAAAALIEGSDPAMNYRDLLLEFIQWCVDNPPEAIFEDGDAAKAAVDAFLKVTDPRDDSERAFDAAYWPEPSDPQVNKEARIAALEKALETARVELVQDVDIDAVIVGIERAQAQQ